MSPEPIAMRCRLTVLLAALTLACVLGLASSPAAAAGDAGRPVMQRGLEAATQGRHTEAVELYSRALQAGLPPALAAKCLTNRGASWYALRRFKAAVKDYTSALAIDPRLVGAYYNRSWAFEALGRLDWAARDMEQVVCLEPDNRAARDRLAELRRRLGREAI